jgi:hypothetical protein
VNGRRSVQSVSNVDGNRILKCLLGIIWKYANAPSEYGRIDIGPYLNRISDCIFQDKKIPDEIDATLLRTQTGDSSVYWYRSPFRETNDDRNWIRFSLGGFTSLVKLDQRYMKAGIATLKNQ